MKHTVSLKQNHQFRRLYSKGKSAVSPTLALYCRKNRLGYSRLGVTVGTKVGKAVRRNRTRRRIREAYRIHEDAFLPGMADFSKMGDNSAGYYLEKVIHATKIEVNEKGTEAAAATVVAAESGAAAPPQEGITLILDRPFLYGIVDLYTGVPLFLGTYE